MSDCRAKQLIEQGEFRKAAAWLNAKKELSQSERILEAHLDLELGDAAAAYSKTEALLGERLDVRSKAYCLTIAGRAQGRLGDPTSGLGRLRKGIALVTEVDSHLTSDLQASLVTAVLSWIGIEPVLAELPRLRRIALSSGNTRALIQFHLIHARVYAMRGLLDRAEAEGQIAADLLRTAPNIYQLGKVRQIQSNASIKASNMVAARRYAQECLVLAEQSGSRAGIVSTLGNLSHIAVLTGEYDEAYHLMDRVLQVTEPKSPARPAAYATGLELALATGNHEYATTMLQSAEVFKSGPLYAESYYDLFFELQRVRWLISNRHYDEAASASMAALKAIEKLADTSLLDRMRLLAAEAHALAGSELRGLDFFSQMCSAFSEFSLETLAETNRVAAVLVARSSLTSARAYLSRAWRVLTATELLGCRAGVERTASDLGIALHGAENSSGHRSPTSVVHTISAMLQLGKHQKALAAEAIALLNSIDFPEAAIVTEAGDVSSAINGAQYPNVLALSLGNQAGHNLELKTRPLQTAEAKMLWGAVDHVVRAANAAAAHWTLQEEQVSLWPNESSATLNGLVVVAESMIDLVGTTRQLAPSDITVLITGETGTGKELLARALHDASPRKQKNFIPFNCSAIARDMLDAQLFGYRRGAFTGAQEAFPGVIRAAAGGTLFLDEIGEISPEVQPKLLRFLESGEIHPLGEPKPLNVDVRIVAATNADLEQLVAEGRFREDLFYRLNVVRLQVPPLRERREEVPPLVQYYLEKCSRESKKNGLRLAEETMEYLILYKWPGNVRQLANEVRRLVALAESGAVLMPEHLSHEISSSRRTIPISERHLAPTEFVVRMDQPMSAAMEHLERSMIQYALKLADSRVEEAAQLLGLSRKGLYLKRQRLGISDTARAIDATIPA